MFVCYLFTRHSHLNKRIGRTSRLASFCFVDLVVNDKNLATHLIWSQRTLHSIVVEIQEYKYVYFACGIAVVAIYAPVDVR